MRALTFWTVDACEGRKNTGKKDLKGLTHLQLLQNVADILKDVCEPLPLSYVKYARTTDAPLQLQAG